MVKTTIYHIVVQNSAGVAGASKHFAKKTARSARRTVQRLRMQEALFAEASQFIMVTRITMTASRNHYELQDPRYTRIRRVVEQR